MFEDFYKLVGPPFKLGPDHRFFFEQISRQGFVVPALWPAAGRRLHRGHGRYRGRQDHAGQSAFSELDKTRFLAAQIVTSNIDADDALRMILSAFGVTPHSNDKAALLRSFEILPDRPAPGRAAGADGGGRGAEPSTRTIEELRMLSNFSVGGQSLFQSFLVGQPQFKEMLADPSLEQFRQRVIASYHLGPMSAEETADYIRHRLRLVGWRNDPAIEPEAFELIYRHSGGIPRRINTLCSGCCCMERWRVCTSSTRPPFRT